MSARRTSVADLRGLGQNDGIYSYILRIGFIPTISF